MWGWPMVLSRMSVIYVILNRALLYITEPCRCIQPPGRGSAYIEKQPKSIQDASISCVVSASASMRLS
ncbi:hypothetical protein RRG08_050628 [Elysia crispata]|uniref:Secreted protein n=1 Tax=Elysia crispata TaxID=231223 RepID=A0AAE0Z371_9GAST|nr:hypothetical protein RRG08_050628 [Elysia crispata]